MVGGCFLNGILDVDGVVFHVGPHVGVDALLVEESECGQFAHRAHHVAAAEELSGTGVEFTQHHMVVGLGVAFQRDVVDTRLLAFGEADFEVDGVVVDGHFHGVGAEEEVAVVHI